MADAMITVRVECHMSRESFGAGFMERQRFVLQQHDRANAARLVLADARAQLSAAEAVGRVSRYQEQWYKDAVQALTVAENGEDAAIGEFADFVYDMITQCPAHSPGHVVDTSVDANEGMPRLVEMSKNRVGEREPAEKIETNPSDHVHDHA